MIRTREKFTNKTIDQMREYTQSRLGKVNEVEIEGHPPGSLRVKTARADGSNTWRVFFEWEPAEADAQRLAGIEHGVFQ